MHRAVLYLTKETFVYYLERYVGKFSAFRMCDVLSSLSNPEGETDDDDDDDAIMSVLKGSARTYL